MNDINSFEIYCQDCNFWFASPIKIYNINSFDSSMMIGNTVTCPKCHDLIYCNTRNIRNDSDIIDIKVQ